MVDVKQSEAFAGLCHGNAFFGIKATIGRRGVWVFRMRLRLMFVAGLLLIVFKSGVKAAEVRRFDDLSGAKAAQKSEVAPSRRATQQISKSPATAGKAPSNAPAVNVEKDFELVEPSGKQPQSLPFDEAHSGIQNLLSYGNELFTDGYLKEAADQFKEVLERDANNVTAKNNLALCEKRLGEIDHSISLLQQAIETEPLKAELHNNLGSAYLSKGESDQALKSFFQALNLRPSYAEVHYNLGHLYSIRRAYDQAVVEYQSALKEKPDDAAYHRDLGDTLNLIKRSEEALIEYREAKRLGDNSLGLKLRVVAVFRDLHQLGEAEKLCNELMKDHPNNAEVLNQLGLTYLRQGKIEPAEQTFNKAISIEPNFAQAINHLGIALYREKHISEAIAVFQQALRIKPDYAEAYYNLGTALYRKGEVANAEKSLLEAIRYNPQDAYAYNNLGLILLRRGNVDEAIENWRKAITIDPFLAAGFINIGRALHASRSVE